MWVCVGVALASAVERCAFIFAKYVKNLPSSNVETNGCPHILLWILTGNIFTSRKELFSMWKLIFVTHAFKSWQMTTTSTGNLKNKSWKHLDRFTHKQTTHTTHKHHRPHTQTTHTHWNRVNISCVTFQSLTKIFVTFRLIEASLETLSAWITRECIPYLSTRSPVTTEKEEKLEDPQVCIFIQTVHAIFVKCFLKVHGTTIIYAIQCFITETDMC